MVRRRSTVRFRNGAPAAQAGDSGRAYRLAADAEALARTVTSPAAQAQVLTGLATAIVQAGNPDRAEALARTVTDPDYQAEALIGLAAAAQAGDSGHAYRLAADAEPSPHQHQTQQPGQGIYRAGHGDRPGRRP